jgi:uncharacterized protein (DUF1810 family)
MATPTGLERFVEAQRDVYDQVLTELREGAKQSHWMWFVFPQIAGLSLSATGRFFELKNLAEAQAYLGHELLGPRLAECTEAMLGWAGKATALSILGPVDALKFKSSMTLFEAAGGGEIFVRALDGFCAGERDPATLALLKPR